MEFNLADLFENAVDHFGDREYLVADGKRRTYKEMDERANRLAHHLASKGIGPGDHVGIYAYNCVEWVEALWAVFKLRAVWININYRYVEDELRIHLRQRRPEGARLRERVRSTHRWPCEGSRTALPLLTHTVVHRGRQRTRTAGTLDSADYEDALAAELPGTRFRSSRVRRRPLHPVHRRGTTGMPKGVVWRHEDVFMALGGGIGPDDDQREW